MTANPHKVAQMKARYWCGVLGHDWAGHPVYDGCNRCGAFRWQPTCTHEHREPRATPDTEYCLDCGCILVTLTASMRLFGDITIRTSSMPAAPQECEDQA